MRELPLTPEERRKAFIRMIRRDRDFGLSREQILYRYKRGLGEDEILELMKEAAKLPSRSSERGAG